jgi:site-specific DNA-methyltransferase (adenine-specific)
MELNKIYNEDCLEGMKYIDDKSIDIILCDLPYGTTACKWDSIIPFDKLWEQYNRIIKDNGAIVLTASQPFTSALVMSNSKLFKYEWIWEKDKPSNFATARKIPMFIAGIGWILYAKYKKEYALMTLYVVYCALSVWGIISWM